MIWNFWKKPKWDKSEEKKKETVKAVQATEAAPEPHSPEPPVSRTVPAPAPRAEPKTAAVAEKQEEGDEKLAEELQKIAPELMAQAKTPEVRQRIISLAKKMKADGVDLKSEKQVGAWMKKHPEAASAPEQKIETYVRSSPKVGRNDPCGCGSGKKHKKCCGK